MWVVWVLLTVFLIAAMSGGMALGMHLLFPRMSERARIVWASGLSAFLPMSLIFGGFFLEADVAKNDFLISVMALVLLSFLILSICCVPAAYFTTSRLGRGKDTPPAIESEEPELIEG